MVLSRVWLEFGWRSLRLTETLEPGVDAPGGRPRHEGNYHEFDR